MTLTAIIPDTQTTTYDTAALAGGDPGETLRDMVVRWAEESRDHTLTDGLRTWYDLEAAADEYAHLLEDQLDTDHTTIIGDTVYTDGTVPYEELAEALDDSDGSLLTEAIERHVDNGTVYTDNGRNEYLPDKWGSLVGSWDKDRIADRGLEDAISEAYTDVMTDTGLTRQDIVDRYYLG